MNEFDRTERAAGVVARRIRGMGRWSALPVALLLSACLIAEGPPEDPNASGTGVDTAGDASDGGGDADGTGGGSDGELRFEGGTALRVDEGAEAPLTTDQLDARYGTESAADALYTVAALPEHGTLQRRAGRRAEPVDLAEGDTFTQAEVTAGLISYRHGGEEVFEDAALVDLSDDLDAIEGLTLDVSVDPVDDPPVISDIDDVSVSEDQPGGTGPLPLTISDPDTALGNLALWISSSSEPDVCQAVLGGRGENRTVTVTSAPNAFGQCAITVSVSDGDTTVTSSFVVRVVAVNDPPVVAPIEPQSFAEGEGTGPIDVVLSDIESTPGSLTLTAESDTTLCEVVTGGSGAARTVEVTGAPDRFGRCVVTVTASDGEDTGSTSFDVFVSSANGGPTISAIANQTIDEDDPDGTGPLAFTVDDPETGATGLAVTLENGNPELCTATLGGADEDRTVAVVAAPDGFGSCAITVHVSDGESTVAESFTVSVTAVNDGPVLGLLPSVVYDEDSDGSDVVEIDVSDVDDALTDLIVSVSSDDPLCRVPSEPLDTPFAFVINSPAQQNGSCVVTVTAEDPGELVASTEFLVIVRESNDPPSIQAFPTSVIFAEDDPAGGGFTLPIRDPDDDVASLAVTVTTSAPEICRVSHERDEDDVIVSVTNVPDQFGSCSVTTRVSDGELEATFTASVTVNPVNDAPTIAPIAPQSIDEEDSVGPVALVVFDVESAVAELSVTAEVADPSLCSATIGGSASAPTLTVDGETDASGLCQVTVTVDDGDLDATTTFFVTIRDLNDAPTISTIADDSFAEDAPGGTGALAFTVGDVETSPAALVVSASNDRPDVCSVQLGGSGTDRTVQVTNLENQAGATCLIELTVSDGELEATESFAVEVVAVNDLPTISAFGPAVIVLEDTVGGTGPIDFTIGDVETPADSLAVDFDNSQNPTLCETVTFGGSGSDRTITVETAEDRSGTCFVDVEVLDEQGESSTSTLEVRVVPVNDPPSVAVEVPVPAPLRPLPGDLLALDAVVSDEDSDEGGVVLLASFDDEDLVSRVEVTGSGTDRTLELTLVAGEFGRGTLEVTAIDAEGAAAQMTEEVRVASGDNGEITWDGLGAFADMPLTDGGWTDLLPGGGGEGSYSDALAFSGSLSARLTGDSVVEPTNSAMSRAFSVRDRLELRARVNVASSLGADGRVGLTLNTIDPVVAISATGDSELALEVTLGCTGSVAGLAFGTWYELHVVLDAGDLSVSLDDTEVCSESGLETDVERLIIIGNSGAAGSFDVAFDDIRLE